MFRSTPVEMKTKNHITNNKKFAPNKTIKKLLEIEIAKFGNFGEIFNKTNEEIKKLESSSQMLKDLVKVKIQRISSLKKLQI